MSNNDKNKPVNAAQLRNKRIGDAVFWTLVGSTVAMTVCIVLAFLR